MCYRSIQTARDNLHTLATLLCYPNLALVKMMLECVSSTIVKSHGMMLKTPSVKPITAACNIIASLLEDAQTRHATVTVTANGRHQGEGRRGLQPPVP